MVVSKPEGRGSAAHRPLVPHRMSTREVAEQYLREMILNGTILPDTRVNEVELAQKLEISRGPLREAIQALASEGLLRVVRYHGAYVKSFSKSELRDLYGVRIALECYAVRDAISSGGVSSDGLRERSLTDFLEATRASLDVEGVYPSSLDFHKYLVSLSSNRYLQQAVADAHARIYLARVRSAHGEDRAKHAYAEHCEIAAAIESGDVAMAVSRLEDHLWKSFENSVQLVGVDSKEDKGRADRYRRPLDGVNS